MQKSNKQMIVLGALLSLVVAVLVVLALGFILVKKLSTNSVATVAARVFNVPVVTVGDDEIPYSEYLVDIKSLKNFYISTGQNNNGESEEILSQQVIARLIANSVIEDMAGELNVEVLEEDVNMTNNQLFGQFESKEDAIEDLQKKYGWDLDTYVQRVVVPLLREQKVREAFNEMGGETEEKYEGGEEIQARHILLAIVDGLEEKEVKELANKILDEIKDGADFAELALKYGNDATNKNGGDLGWFGKGIMIPEFEEAVFGLEVNELYQEPLKSEFGYHIIQKTGERISKDFDKYLQDKIAESEVTMNINVPNPFES